MSLFVCVLNFVLSWTMGRVRESDVSFVISTNDITSKESRFLGEFDTKLKSDKRI